MSVKRTILVLFWTLMMAMCPGYPASAAGESTGTAGGESGEAAFAGGVLQPIPDMTGTRLKVTRSFDPLKPPDNNTVAFAYHFVFLDSGDDYTGHYLYYTVNKVNEYKTVYGVDQQRCNVRFDLPAMLSTDIDMHWFGNHRVIFDKEKNIVMTLEDSYGDLQVAAYQASGLALKDVIYLGVYRSGGQPKLIVSDESRVYVVDARTMRNERDYDLRGLKPIGANIGLRLEKRDSRLGVWLVSRDNRTMHYLDLPSGEISREADLAQYNIAGEILKMVSGWSGYVTGGYGGVILVKDNQNYALYEGKFKWMADRYPHGGKPLGDVKDIYWAIVHGVRTRAAVVVIERDDLYLVSHSIEAKEFYEEAETGSDTRL